MRSTKIIIAVVLMAFASLSQAGILAGFMHGATFATGYAAVEGVKKHCKLVFDEQVGHKVLQCTKPKTEEQVQPQSN